MGSHLSFQCDHLKQIGQSNNSIVFKELDKDNVSNGKVFKAIKHSEKDVHAKECAHLKNEYHILSKLDHPCIVKVHNLYKYQDLPGANPSPVANQPNQSSLSQVCGLELELAECDLYEFLSKNYPKMIKIKHLKRYFQGIADALNYLHEKNITHNDIKLENIFLFNKCEMAKLADFGFSRKDGVKSRKKQLKDWQRRCKETMAPEFLEAVQSQSLEQVLDEKKSDVFMFGVALFSAVFLCAPFDSNRASRNDQLFKHFYSGRTEDFWNHPEIKKKVEYVTASRGLNIILFKDLINKVLNVNPDQRITMKEVLEHPWLTQEATVQLPNYQNQIKKTEDVVGLKQEIINNQIQEEYDVQTEQIK